MKKYGWILLFFIASFILTGSADNAPVTERHTARSSINSASTNNSEPLRRAKPAPFDDIFPGTEYIGPTIGVPNTDPIYPLTKLFWNALPILKDNDIRIYGWVNPSFNLSTSKNSNIPLSYTIVPNALELEQLVLRAERVPNTVQTDHVDWGFRLSNMYGIDYRYTVAQGIFSDQLLKHNNLYGYDPVEAYGQLYFPDIAQGMLVTFGRYISPPDIETQFAPQNYLVTHSVMFTFDQCTQTGVNAAIKLNDQWTVLLGIHTGGDVAPWASGANFPSILAMLRWVSQNNNDSLWGGVNSFNGEKFTGNHDNLQQFNLTWTHRFNKSFHTTTEVYYIYQEDAAKGGTCNFGSIRSYGGGGGCGPIIPGFSASLGIVNYLELKLSEKNFASFRTDFLDDFRGQRTGFATEYMSLTLGLTHRFTNVFSVRPEIRYETAFDKKPYDNGTRKDQSIFVVDAIYRF